MSNLLVNEFAKKQGYQWAKYLCNWNGFKCYEPIISKNEVAYLGLPLLILEDADGNIRMSTPEEAMEQLSETE